MYKKLLANPAMKYILTRYITYGIQFVNSIFIAVYLGPVYLGIWGFINLVIQYLNQINFGISHSVITIAAINKHKKNYVSNITGNAVVTLSFLSLVLGVIFLSNYIFDWDFGEKYNFSTYSLFILLIAILTYFNNLFSNILRVYGRIMEMAFSQSLLPLATVGVLFFYREEDLLLALTWTSAFTTLISFFVFIIRVPIKININFNLKLWKTIQKKGLHLFIYNSSFYLIVLSTRSFISYYFEIKEFGYFTFAFSLANVLILLLDSFSFLIWPKLLNRLSKLNNLESYKLISEIRKVYITSTHGLLHIVICLFPYFLIIFPKYNQTHIAFCLIAMTIVLFTNSFGYQGLIIARGKEKLIGILSVITLVMNISLCYILILWFHVNYDYVILATMICYIFYIIILSIIGRLTLKLNLNVKELFNDIFPINLFLPFITSLSLVLLKLDYYYYIIPLCVFLFLNMQTLKKLKNMIKTLIVNPSFFEI